MNTMKKFSSLLLLGVLSLGCMAQPAEPGKTLLWKIEGNGLEKPSWLFGTIHMICKEDADLSDNLNSVISKVDHVYFEMDLDNFLEILGGMTKLRMRGDTTLKDLLSPEEYERVKAFFEKKSTAIPFRVIETYKPMMASSLLSESAMPCEGAVSMEQVIMQTAKEKGKRIKGLETIAQQAGFLDSIPYRYQAGELLKYVDSADQNGGEDKMMEALFSAYRNQDLDSLDALMNDPASGMTEYADIMLFNRNINWVTRLNDLMKEKSLLVAVGAGHLPGEKGVIRLLQKAGYTVSPVDNKKVKNRII